MFPEALAPRCEQAVTSLLKTQPFGLLLDESNDRGCNKELVILARVHDPSDDTVCTKFVDMPVCNEGTGQNLFDTVNRVFQ